MAAGLLAALQPDGALGQQQVLTKEYDNGGVYEGGFLDGRQHGRRHLPPAERLRIHRRPSRRRSCRRRDS